SRFQTSDTSIPEYTPQLPFLMGSFHHLSFSHVSRFWYVKMKALTEAKDFEGLDAFAKSKRSPIGYEPFVRHLLEQGHAKEAAGYVAKCDSPKRADLYAECGEWRLAG